MSDHRFHYQRPMVLYLLPQNRAETPALAVAASTISTETAHTGSSARVPTTQGDHTPWQSAAISTISHVTEGGCIWRHTCQLCDGPHHRRLCSLFRRQPTNSYMTPLRPLEFKWEVDLHPGRRFVSNLIYSITHGFNIDLAHTLWHQTSPRQNNTQK